MKELSESDWQRMGARYAIMKKIWDDKDDHLLSSTKARELSTAEIKMNHPLMLMVNEQRTVSEGGGPPHHPSLTMWSHSRVSSDIPFAWHWSVTSGTGWVGTSTLSSCSSTSSSWPL